MILAVPYQPYRGPFDTGGNNCDRKSFFRQEHFSQPHENALINVYVVGALRVSRYVTNRDNDYTNIMKMMIESRLMIDTTVINLERNLLLPLNGYAKTHFLFLIEYRIQLYIYVYYTKRKCWTFIICSVAIHNVKSSFYSHYCYQQNAYYLKI